jgi:predicted transcriptional regulator
MTFSQKTRTEGSLIFEILKNPEPNTCPTVVVTQVNHHHQPLQSITRDIHFNSDFFSFYNPSLQSG